MFYYACTVLTQLIVGLYTYRLQFASQALDYFRIATEGCEPLVHD